MMSAKNGALPPPVLSYKSKKLSNSPSLPCQKKIIYTLTPLPFLETVPEYISKINGA